MLSSRPHCPIDPTCKSAAALSRRYRQPLVPARWRTARAVPNQNTQPRMNDDYQMKMKQRRGGAKTYIHIVKGIKEYDSNNFIFSLMDRNLMLSLDIKTYMYQIAKPRPDLLHVRLSTANDCANSTFF